MLHIVDAAAKKAVEGNAKTVGVLGSRYTMTGTYFVGRLQREHNLKVLVAKGEHQTNIHNALYSELAKGVILPETQDKFRAALADLVARGAEMIILACTEFGMIVGADDCTVPIVDTSVAHCEAAIELALAA